MGGGSVADRHTVMQARHFDKQLGGSLSFPRVRRGGSCWWNQFRRTNWPDCVFPSRLPFPFLRVTARASYPEEFLKLPRPTDQRGIRALRRPRRQGAPRRCRRDGGLSPPRAVHSFSLELSPPPLMFPFSFDGANMDPLEMG